MPKPTTCRYCSISTRCTRRQRSHILVYGDNLYKATQEQTDKTEALLAGTCKEEREAVKI